MSGTARLGALAARAWRSPVLRSAAGISLLRAGNFALRFLIPIVVARALGAAGLGAYSLVLAWVNVLAAGADLGFKQYLARDVARASAAGRWGALKGGVGAAFAAVVGLAAVLAAAAFAVAAAVPEAAPRAVPPAALALGLAAVPPLAGLGVLAAVMRGLRAPAWGQSGNQIIRPAVFVAAVGGAWAGGWVALDLTLLMAAQLGAVLVGFAFVAAALARRWPAPAATAPAERPGRAWFLGVLPFAAYTVTQAVNTEANVLILGALADTADVGLYRAAERLATLVVFPLLALESPVGPRLASAHERGESERVQQLITRTTLVATAGGVCVAAVFLGFGEPVLALFGPEFGIADSALAIMSLLHCVQVALGPAIMVLLMTGHVSAAATGMLGATALNVALAVILVPGYGIEGAALARGVALVAMTAVLAVAARRRLGVGTGVWRLWRAGGGKMDTEAD